MTEVCSICGGIKFEVYFEDKILYRCINCQKTIEEVKIANGINVKD